MTARVDPRFDAIWEKIEASSRILLVSHLRPDGDAVGSLLGLGLVLADAGKAIQMVLEDGVPGTFRGMEGADQIDKEPDGIFDCAVVLDCSDLLRTGSALEDHGRPQINIDHHPTNLGFAEHNLVIESACSTTEIVYDLVRAADVPISEPAAEALLTGLVTDTIGFQTPNITPRALRTAAALMEYGPNLSAIYRQTLIERSFEAFRYWGSGLSTLQRENGLVWAVLSMADRRAVGYRGSDDADLINQLSAIQGSKVRIIFIEQSPSEVKVSWRSQPGFDVSGIARSFGGGGHRTAAGATVTGTLEEVQHKVLRASRELKQSG
jgi:phosphoesterase RecJ-like protein